MRNDDALWHVASSQLKFCLSQFVLLGVGERKGR
jgi:hypothetical protein